MKKIVLSLIAILCLVNTLSAYDLHRQYPLFNYSVNEGLSQHDNNDIIQDAYGYIWVCSYDGLNRYDGYTFKKFYYDPNDSTSLSDNRVLAVAVDRKKRLWVGTDSQGFSMYDYESESFVNYTDILPNNTSVTAIYFDGNDTMWIGSPNGLYQVESKGQVLRVVNHFFVSDTPGLANSIMSITRDKSGLVFVGTRQGLKVLTNGDGKYRVAYEVDAFGFVNNVVVDAGEVYICCDKGLFYGGDYLSKVSRGEAEIKKVVASVNLPGVINIHCLPNNKCLIVSRRGLFEFDGQECRSMPASSKKYFVDNIIKCSIVDRDGNLWIGSGQYGVAKVYIQDNRVAIQSFDSVKGSMIRAVDVDPEGNVWFGDRINGIRTFDFEKQQSIRPRSISHTESLTSLAIDSKGYLWSISRLVVSLYDTKREQSVDISLNEENGEIQNPTIVRVDKQDGVWFGGDGYVAKVDSPRNNPSVKHYNLSAYLGYEGGDPTDITLDVNNHILWISTKDDGVLALYIDDNGEVVKSEHLSSQNGLYSNHVWALKILSDGAVLIGSDVGLLRCDVDQNNEIICQLVNLNAPYTFSKVVAIEEDRNGFIWCSVSRGLLRYDFRADETLSFNNADGLCNSSLLEGMNFDSKNNVLYVASIDGLNYIDLSSLVPNKTPANILFSDLIVCGDRINVGERYKGHTILEKSILFTDELDLDYDQNDITINFSSTHLVEPSKNRYAYKLEGYDDDWIFTTSERRYAQYSQLGSGSYTLRVKSSNNNGMWLGEERTLDINIRRAPLVSWWAILIYILIVILVSYYLYSHALERRLLRKSLIIEQIESKNSKQMQEMTKRFYSSIAHDIRTPLTLIAAPVEELLDSLNDDAGDSFVASRLKIISKNLSRMLYLVGQFLDVRDNSYGVGKVEVSYVNVDTFFDEVGTAFSGLAEQKDIRFERVVDTSSKVLGFDKDKVSKIVYNLLSNAFKYTDTGGEVFLFVEQIEQNLVVNVVDTGIGIADENCDKVFECYYRVSETGRKGLGIGLSLVKEFVEALSGSIKLTSEVGKGSQFTVTIPCQSNLPFEPVEELECEVSDRREDSRSVLVVDDDEQIRQYIASCLTHNGYVTYDASNGQDAFDKALRYTPNLIISDVVMPKMDGFSLARHIKNDMRTSHIPILLVSAQDDFNNELKGLSAGADDYICKPFSIKSLMLKVNNITSNIRVVQGSQLSELDKEEHKNTPDQQFLASINDIIITEAANPLFCINYICEKMAISRMQLHRKMVHLLGKSTAEYIREVKLDLAKQLLLSGEDSVADVMVKVGVNSLSHFNKNFKERFGVLPSAVTKDHNA